jgi:hypothetical protein
MKKLLIFGDSHISNIFDVYTKKKSALDICFFPSLGPVAKYVEFKNGKLILLPAPMNWPDHPTISKDVFQKWYDMLKKKLYAEAGGKLELSLNNFDSVVIYGGTLLPISGFKWWELTDQDHNYSIALCSDILEEKIKDSIGGKWIDGLASYVKNQGDLHVALNPYLNVEGFKYSDDSAQDLSTLKSIPNGSDIRKIFPIYRRLFDQKGINFIYPPQDLYKGDNRAVASKFKSPKPSDFYHLNSEGASLMLNQIISGIL